MNELIIYGVCLALTIALLAVVVRRKGFEVLLPLIMAPPLLAAFITRDRVNLFAPNGSHMKPITRVVTGIIALLTVPFLGSVLYGLYRTTAWLVATEIAARTAPQAGALLMVNTLLWPLSAGVVGLLLVHLGQSWQWILGTNNPGILFGYAAPLVMHGLAFGVLAATRHHLLQSPGAGTFPGFATAAAAVGCTNLLAFTLVRNLLGYKTLLGKVQGAADRTLRLFRVLSLLHAGLFGYYLARVFFFL